MTYIPIVNDRPIAPYVPDYVRCQAPENSEARAKFWRRRAPLGDLEFYLSVCPDIPRELERSGWTLMRTIDLSRPYLRRKLFGNHAAQFERIILHDREQRRAHLDVFACRNEPFADGARQRRANHGIFKFLARHRELRLFDRRVRRQRLGLLNRALMRSQRRFVAGIGRVKLLRRNDLLLEQRLHPFEVTLRFVEFRPGFDDGRGLIDNKLRRRHVLQSEAGQRLPQISLGAFNGIAKLRIVNARKRLPRGDAIPQIRFDDGELSLDFRGHRHLIVRFQRPRQFAVRCCPPSPETLKISHQIRCARRRQRFLFGNHRFVRGFLLNNELTDFSLVAEWATDREPRRGAQASAQLDVADLRVRRGGRLVMIVGSPGGHAIIHYVARVIVAVLDWGMPLQAALDAPHFGSRNGPTDLEANTPVARLQPQLEALGHPVRVLELASGVHAIFRVGDSWVGAADPRRGGTARGQ